VTVHTPGWSKCTGVRQPLRRFAGYVVDLPIHCGALVQIDAMLNFKQPFAQCHHKMQNYCCQAPSRSASMLNDTYNYIHRSNRRHTRLRELQAGSDHLNHATAIDQQQPQAAAPLKRRAVFLAWAFGSVALDQLCTAVATCHPAQATAAGMQLGRG